MMKLYKSRFYLVLLVFVLMLSTQVCVFASDLDDLTGGGNYTSSTNEGNSSNPEDSNKGVTDYLKDYKPVTSENMESSSKLSAPIVNIIGNFVGFAIAVLGAGIMAVTVIDLAYIGIPFLRNTLNPQQQTGAPMGMGMGQQSAPAKKCWVSDEAIACLGTSQAQQPQGGLGGMQGGFGGMSGFGGMGGISQPQQQQAQQKSPIVTYLKKRTVFIVIFVVALIVLTSSLLTNCGINLAQLSFKIIDKLNNLVSGINIG